MRVLAGDVGGTKTRLAVFDVQGTHLDTVTERSYPSGSYNGLENIVEDFLGGTSSDCQQACFGIAGPVQRGRVQTTNLPWIVEEQSLAALFGFERAMISRPMPGGSMPWVRMTST
jgi:glucokinase